MFRCLRPRDCQLMYGDFFVTWQIPTFLWWQHTHCQHLMTTSSQLRSIVFVRLSSAEKIACWIQLSMKYFSKAALRRKDNRMIQQLVINVINAYFAYWWVGVRLLRAVHKRRFPFMGHEPRILNCFISFHFQ